MTPQEDNVSRQSRSAVFVVIERRVGESIQRTSTTNTVEGCGGYILHSHTGMFYAPDRGGTIEVYAE
jgi:hypothetical protein